MDGDELYPCVTMVYGLLEAKIRLKESREGDTEDNRNVSNVAAKDESQQTGSIKSAKKSGEEESAQVDSHATGQSNRQSVKRNWDDDEQERSKFESTKSHWDDDEQELSKFESTKSHWDDDEREHSRLESAENRQNNESLSPMTMIKEKEEDTTQPYASPSEDLYTKWSSQYHSKQVDVDEEEEEETCNYKKAEDLEDDDRYMLRLAHGWDFVMRGGLLLPHPNIPYICVPMPNLQDKVQVC